MEFRTGDEPTMAELDAMTTDAPVKAKKKEAGKDPAVSMADKGDLGSDALVAQAAAEAMVKAVTAPKIDDSKSVQPR
ncbi:MAG: hypothetical protein O9272_12100, partial [Brevundimonas sp.]|nr:hypothetical protein [Brevundimonas sp.]